MVARRCWRACVAVQVPDYAHTHTPALRISGGDPRFLARSCCIPPLAIGQKIHRGGFWAEGEVGGGRGGVYVEFKATSSNLTFFRADTCVYTYNTCCIEEGFVHAL
jgi:hypothetical protein